MDTSDWDVYIGSPRSLTWYAQIQENVFYNDEKKRRLRADADPVLNLPFMILKSRWEFLLHPIYSPDLAPSDYHFFRSHPGQHFTKRDDVEKYIIDFINSKDEAFYQMGIKLLSKGWKKCMETYGEYFQA